MPNIFSSPQFLAAAGDTMVPDASAEVLIGTLGGHRFRLLGTGGRALTDLPFFDFYEPAEDGDGNAVRLGYLPRACLESVAVASWQASPGVHPSPWIDWGQFPAWEDFQAHVSRRGGKSSSIDKRVRKLARERGAVTFDFETRDEGLLELGLEWKSRQYRSTGLLDPLASPRTSAFFRRLFADGVLVVSVLFAGGSPVAIHLGCRWNGRFYYWVPAYEESAAALSPGRILLESLIEHSFRQGDREFDFLIGSEEYKFRYATDVRLVRELGSPPLARKLWRPLRGAIMSRVRRFERPYRALQDLKRRIRQRGMR